MSWTPSIRRCAVDELHGLTLTKIENDEDGAELIFFVSGGRVFKLFHEQDCCESVSIDDIEGDLHDLIGEPLTLAEEVSGTTHNELEAEAPLPSLCGDYSYTWTFYRFATRKGRVTVRWFGTSNGYYSERVTFAEVFS